MSLIHKVLKAIFESSCSCIIKNFQIFIDHLSNLLIVIKKSVVKTNALSKRKVFKKFEEASLGFK